MLRWLVRRVLPAAVTSAIVVILLSGMLWVGVSQVVIQPGGNPSAIVFPGPFWIVYGITGSVAAAAATTSGGTGFPTGVCAVGAATTTGHNTFFASVTPFAATAPTSATSGFVTSYSGSAVTFTNSAGVGGVAATYFWLAVCN